MPGKRAWKEPYRRCSITLRADIMDVAEEIARAVGVPTVSRLVAFAAGLGIRMLANVVKPDPDVLARIQAYQASRTLEGLEL